jgi:alkylation response protein AidB-like acyl-CoA dehydrogenase
MEPSRQLLHLFDEIERIRPLIEGDAEAAERAGHLTPDVLDALIETQLFRLLIPQDYGGLELDMPDALDVMERVSAIDGATGWTVMIGAGGGPFAAFLDPDVADEIFGPVDAVIAGSGTPSGRAFEEDDGYLATGRWRYSSGAPHATWFTGNCIVHGVEGPVEMEDGSPLIRAMAFPADEVEIIETWDTVGMSATASHDYRVDEIFVPESHTFSVFDDEPQVDGLLYRFPFVSQAELTFGAVGLGIAAHALDLFHVLAQSKTPAQSTARLSRMPHAQAAYGEALATLQSARAWYWSVAQESWDTVADGDELSPRAMAEVHLASVHATASAARAVDLLHDVAGMEPMQKSSALGRCWRDIHAVTQHGAVSAPRGYPAAGETLLGLPTGGYQARM